MIYLRGGAAMEIIITLQWTGKVGGEFSDPNLIILCELKILDTDKCKIPWNLVLRSLNMPRSPPPSTVKFDAGF